MSRTTRTSRTTTPATPSGPTGRLPRAAAVLALAAAAVAVSAASASAHVTVRTDNASAGGYAQLTFRVPTESDTAGTTKLVVDLPADTPFTSVRTKPMAGWTATVTEGDLPSPVDVNGTTLTKAARTVTWTAAAGGEVGPGQYQDFQLSVGPLPAEPGQLVLPATQTYSDGEVVAWAEPTPEGGEEPDLPAPAFAVTAAEGDGHDGADGGAVEEASADAVAPAEGGSDADPVARWLAGGGLLAGLAGLGLAVAGRRRAGA